MDYIRQVRIHSPCTDFLGWMEQIRRFMALGGHLQNEGEMESHRGITIGL